MLLSPESFGRMSTRQRPRPIYVGTNQNFGLTGPPPLIAALRPTPHRHQVRTPWTPAQGVPPQGLPVPTVPRQFNGSGHDTGAQAAPPSQALNRPLIRSTGRGTTAGDLTAPQTTKTGPMAQILGDTATRRFARRIRSISRASIRQRRVGASTVSVTVTFNPALLRVRTVQEGVSCARAPLTSCYAEHRSRHRRTI